MFKSLLSVVVITFLALTVAQAKTLKLPNEEFPIASINIPDSWEPEEINNGVAGTSDDGAV
ncbi:MAG: histidine kinase, partial [Chthoniobacterales bacterium]